MRLLVIGKNGQLATALRRACVNEAGVFLQQIGRPEFDLKETQALAIQVAAHRPDVVINAAAYTAVDAAETNEEMAIRINADAADEVARGAALAGASVIQVSTDYVFDGSKPIPYLETDRPSPIGAYGRSKLEGEYRVVAANQRHVIIRTSWIFSPYRENFLCSMLKLGRARQEIGIVADQIGTPTSADDLAAAILAIATRVHAEQREDFFGVTHLCGTGIASWYDLARQTFRAAADLGYDIPLVKPITTSEYPTPAARPTNSRLDTRRLETLFGIVLPEWSESVRRDVTRLLDGDRV